MPLPYRDALPGGLGSSTLQCASGLLALSFTCATVSGGAPCHRSVGRRRIRHDRDDHKRRSVDERTALLAVRAAAPPQRPFERRSHYRLVRAQSFLSLVLLVVLLVVLLPTSARGAAPGDPLALGAAAGCCRNPITLAPLLNCTCLATNTDLTLSVPAGAFAYFHWRLPDLAAVDVEDAARPAVTFTLSPCYGASHLLVSPGSPPLPTLTEHWWMSAPGAAADVKSLSVPLEHTEYFGGAYAVTDTTFRVTASTPSSATPTPGGGGNTTVVQVDSDAVEVRWKRSSQPGMLYRVYYVRDPRHGATTCRVGANRSTAAAGAAAVVAGAAAPAAAGGSAAGGNTTDATSAAGSLAAAAAAVPVPMPAALFSAQSVAAMKCSIRTACAAQLNGIAAVPAKGAEAPSAAGWLSGDIPATADTATWYGADTMIQRVSGLELDVAYHVTVVMRSASTGAEVSYDASKGTLTYVRVETAMPVWIVIGVVAASVLFASGMVFVVFQARRDLNSAHKVADKSMISLLRRRIRARRLWMTEKQVERRYEMDQVLSSDTMDLLSKAKRSLVVRRNADAKSRRKVEAGTFQARKGKGMVFNGIGGGSWVECRNAVGSRYWINTDTQEISHQAPASIPLPRQ